jgi:uncharacterized protein
MKVEEIQNFSLKNIVLISSLPDMGKVGGLVTQHLKKKLKTKQACKIILADKPWVNLKKGLIDLPQDEYEISVDEKNSIVIFSGENQPQEPTAVFATAEKVLSLVKKMGNIKMVITTGGYLPSENGNGTRVFGVATNSKSLDLLKSFDVNPLGTEVNTITWFNGLILGLSKVQKINGVGLFGEIADSETPQYKTASNIVKIIGKIIQVDIDTSELDKKVTVKPVKVKKEGPGIG